jgi:hypothetical protein
MTIDEQGVTSAIRVLLATTALPDGDPTTVSQILRQQLASTDFPDAICEELATLVPLAFSREVLRHVDCAIDYPQFYVAASAGSGAETQHPLSGNAIYNTACSIAGRWESDGEKVRIASFSGEFRALTNLLEDGKARGSKLERASVSPPYVYSAKAAEEPEVENRKPWWRFW